MKQKLNVGFVTTYSGRWPKELPEQRDKEYGAWLEEQFPQINVVKASQIGCTKEALKRLQESSNRPLQISWYWYTVRLQGTTRLHI